MSALLFHSTNGQSPAVNLREALLAGQRAVPRKLEETGFVFRHPDLEGALRHLLRG